jgi:hypothetical protein
MLPELPELWDIKDRVGNRNDIFSQEPHLGLQTILFQLKLRPSDPIKTSRSLHGDTLRGSPPQSSVN